MKKYGITKNQFVERIMNREDNKYYKREAVREIIDMYNDEIRKSLLDGYSVNISKVGVIVPNIRPVNMNLYSSSYSKGYETYPFVDIQINKNPVLKNELNNKLRKNLIKNGKLELSENMPPLSSKMKEWENKYVKTHK